MKLYLYILSLYLKKEYGRWEAENILHKSIKSKITEKVGNYHVDGQLVSFKR
jgi:hypothetical protein